MRHPELEVTIEEIKDYYGARWREIYELMLMLIEAFPDGTTAVLWGRETAWNAARLAEAMLKLEETPT